MGYDSELLRWAISRAYVARRGPERVMNVNVDIYRTLSSKMLEAPRLEDKLLMRAPDSPSDSQLLPWLDAGVPSLVLKLTKSWKLDNAARPAMGLRVYQAKLFLFKFLAG